MSVSESITVYRCAKCGTTETTFGGIRRHIESHRSMREFFKIEEMAFMYEFTERYEIPIEEATEYRTGARGEGR